MHFNKFILSLIFGMVPFFADAQVVGDWKVYSSYSTINSISISPGQDIYAATLGGLFTVRDESISENFTTIDGLHRLDILETAFDSNNNKLILGYNDGVISVYDPTLNTFSSVVDISRVEQFTSKQINDIEVNGDEIYVATDFGIIVFTSPNLLVESSYLTIGNFLRGSSIEDLEIVNDSILVASEAGYASASLNDNLLSPESWDSFQVFLDEIPTSFFDVERLNELTLVMKGDSLLRFQNGAVESIENLNPLGVIELDSNSEHIAVAYESQVYLINENLDLESIFEDSNISIRSILLTESRLIIGTTDRGIISISLNSLEQDQFLPVGPYLNFISEVKFQDNTLLATSTNQFPSVDVFNPFRGYYIYENENWESYNQSSIDVMNDYNFGLVYTGHISEENFFIGSWGRGIIKHNIGTNELDVYNSFNSGFTGIEANRDYIVIGGIDGDSEGNVWATSLQSETPLNLYSSSTQEWVHLPKVGIPTSDEYFKLFVDSNDLKWITLFDFSNNWKGLVVVDTGQDLTDPTDDTFRQLFSDSNNGNLPDERVNAILEDKNGEVWIGTARGIARFIFPQFIIESTNGSEINAQWLINEDTSAVSRFLLRDVNVTAMAVNEANQKWIGSANQGLWLLNPEGSRIEKRFTTENSPLISDNILSIAIDDHTGEVFISTELGLVSFVDTPVSPVQKMDKLIVYPNPFVYERNDMIIVDELSDATNIKVLGVDGSVVHEFETQGGRASWNGRDFFGNELASGVYFLVALSSDGNEKGIGKVVIIR